MSLFSKSVVNFLIPFMQIKNAVPAVFVTQTRSYAARKGYRQEKSKSKVKAEAKKNKFEIKKKENLPIKGSTRKFDDSWKKLPSDDVFPQKFYQWKVYSFNEAVSAHRETHHPQMYNQPNAYLHATVELNMIGEKKNKFLDNFTRMAKIPNKFEHGEERTILAFTKAPETVAELKKAGAMQAGGVELIKQVQNGAISLQDFQYIIAHPNILPELTVLRGLMKKRFPSVKNGNLDTDLVDAVMKFYHGINYTGAKDEFEEDFGIIEAKIGTLNMDPMQLEENFIEFINDVQEHKPKKAGSFVTRTFLWSPPSHEKFKIDHNFYIRKNEEKLGELEESEEVSEITENERSVAV